MSEFRSLELSLPEFEITRRSQEWKVDYKKSNEIYVCSFNLIDFMKF